LKGLTKTPLKIVTKNPRHKLADTSRLNYAKTYTVEYNVKVWFIGNVEKDSMWHLVTDFNQVHPPLGTYGMTQPLASRDEETSYASGGMDEYVTPAQRYGPGLSSSSSASYGREPSGYPQQQYVTTYDQPQASYVASEEYPSSHSDTSYNESRPSRSKGKGKQIQRDDVPAYDIAEGLEEQDHVYDRHSYEDSAEPVYEAQYDDAYSQARHDEGDYAEPHYGTTQEHHIAEEPLHEPLHPEAAEYEPHAAYEYPATTEDYPHGQNDEYAEPIVAHGEVYYTDEHVRE
jgi:hypothetical protein